MKVCQLTESMKTGGIETLIFNLAKIQEEEFDVTITYLPHEDGKYVNLAKDAGIKTAGVKKISIKNFFWYRKFLNQFDIIHSQGGKLMFFALLATNKPIIYTIHNTNYPHYEEKWGKYLYKLFMPKVKAVTACSTAAGVNAEKFFQSFNSDKKIHVVQNGIPSSTIKTEIKSAPNSNSLRLISVNNLSARKGNISGIRALSKTPNQNTLTIVGDGEELDNLKNEISSLALSDRVYILGDRNDILEQLDKHDVYLSTSYMEGMPIAVLESMSRGLPLIARRIEGLSDIAIENENSLLFDTDDEIPGLIKKLASDKELYEKLSKGALNTAKEHTLERAANQYKKLYKNA